MPGGIYSTDATDLLFTFFINVWVKGEFPGDDEANGYDDFYVFNSMAVMLDYIDNDYSSMFASVAKSELEVKGVIGDDLLIGIDLYEGGELNGNGAFVDNNGHITTVPLPTTEIDGGDLDLWVPMCMCKGDPKNVKIVPKEYSLLNSDALPLNKCHFYLLCPCPSDFSLAKDCSNDDLETFFCTICVDCKQPDSISKITW